MVKPEVDNYIPTVVWVTAQIMLLVVARKYQMLPHHIIVMDRRARRLMARRTVMYLMRDYMGLSLIVISKILGRDHSTIAHHVMSMTKEVSDDPAMQKFMQEIIDQFEADSTEAYESILAIARPPPKVLP